MTTRSHTRLRFTYNFEAADGTQIRLSAKLNLRYRETSDDDSQSYSMKLRAKAQVSVLQQNVSSGVGSLLDSPAISPEAQTAIAHALDLFQQVADTVTSAFLESNPLDGDPLITGIVDAFNTLAASIGATSPSLPAVPPEIPAGDQVALLAPAAVPPTEVPAAPTTADNGPPVNVAAEPPAVVPPLDTAPSTLPAADAVDNTDDAHQVGTPVSADTTSAEATSTDTVPAGSGEVEGSNTDQSLAPTTNEPRHLSASSVLLSVRVKVIQSLTSLVGVFGSDSSSTTVSQSVFQASAQLFARYSFVTQNASDSVPRDDSIDAQV